MSNGGFSGIDFPKLAREEKSKKSFYEEGKLFESPEPEAASGRKLILLRDWWLVVADSGSGGKRLGVGGFVFKGTKCFSFSSAYILKRHDASTVETVDGITLKLHGFVNKFRTLCKGFSEEVTDDFIFGFPDNWEEHAVLSVGRDPSASKEFSPSTEHEIPVQEASESNGFNVKAIEAAFSALNGAFMPTRNVGSSGPST